MTFTHSASFFYRNIMFAYKRKKKKKEHMLYYCGGLVELLDCFSISSCLTSLKKTALRYHHQRPPLLLRRRRRWMMMMVMKRRIRRTGMRTRRKVVKRHAADQQFRPLPFPYPETNVANYFLPSSRIDCT